MHPKCFWHVDHEMLLNYKVLCSVFRLQFLGFLWDLSWPSARAKGRPSGEIPWFSNGQGEACGQMEARIFLRWGSWEEAILSCGLIFGRVACISHFSVRLLCSWWNSHCSQSLSRSGIWLWYIPCLSPLIPFLTNEQRKQSPVALGSIWIALYSSVFYAYEMMLIWGYCFYWKKRAYFLGDIGVRKIKGYQGEEGTEPGTSGKFSVLPTVILSWIDMGKCTNRTGFITSYGALAMATACGNDCSL